MNVIPILFNYSDLKNIYPNVKSFYAFISRKLKSGEIKQIKKGLYALVDRSTGDIYASKFQIASRLFDDAYFSYHEALEYYGLANQSYVSRFIYLTHVYVRDIEFDDVVYSSIKSNCVLEIRDLTKENGIRIATLERTIVDCIDNLSYSGGLEEIEKALEGCEHLNIDSIIKILEFYNKAFLYQKVGYLFEKHLKDKIPTSFYKLCLSKSGNTIRYFGAKVGFSKLVLKWKLMVPEERILPDDIF